MVEESRPLPGREHGAELDTCDATPRCSERVETLANNGRLAPHWGASARLAQCLTVDEPSRFNTDSSVKTKQTLKLPTILHTINLSTVNKITT